jgi:UDP-glucose 6-dehydrogenase
MLLEGEIPIYEPGLTERLGVAVAQEYLSFADGVRSGLNMNRH